MTNGVDLRITTEHATADVGRAADRAIESVRAAALSAVDELELASSFKGMEHMMSAERAFLFDFETDQDYPVDAQIELSIWGRRFSDARLREKLERGKYRAVLTLVRR